MIRLSIDDLKKIKDIVNELEVEQFTLKQEGRNGIGNVLTLECETFVADYSATIVVEVNGVKDW
jgi:hypothetical protein